MLEREDHFYQQSEKTVKIYIWEFENIFKKIFTIETNRGVSAAWSIQDTKWSIEGDKLPDKTFPEHPRKKIIDKL